MTTYFINGHFINPTNFNEKIEMLGTRNGKITYKGVLNQNKLATSKRIIDLKGNTLLPGFNDSHIHLLGLGKSLNELDFSNTTSIKELIIQSQSFIESRNLPLLEGRGWNQENFIENRLLTKKDLDQISTKIPIIFRRACGHILVANSKAIELIRRVPSKISGGSVNLTTGLFKENGMDILLNQLPKPSLSTIKKFFIDGAQHVRKLGITSVQSDDLCVYPQEVSSLIFKVLKSFEKNFPVRLYEQSLFRTYKNFKNFIDHGYHMTTEHPYINYGPLKILLDGALGSKTAYLLSPYKGETHRGIRMYSQEALSQLVTLAHHNKIDVAIHGIGDGAIDMAIRSIESLDSSFEHRHSIIHCQLTNAELINRMVKQKILAHIQPIFLDKDIHIVESRIGKNRMKQSYAFKTMHQKNIPIAFGSDSPVDRADPILGIHCAVNRTDLNGHPIDGWLPKEKITVEQALYFYTVNAAYAERQEDKKGTLELGYAADFTILDKNPLTIKSKDLKTINIVDTYVAGKNFNKNDLA